MVRALCRSTNSVGKRAYDTGSSIYPQCNPYPRMNLVLCVFKVTWGAIIVRTKMQHPAGKCCTMHQGSFLPEGVISQWSRLMEKICKLCSLPCLAIAFLHSQPITKRGCCPLLQCNNCRDRACQLQSLRRKQCSECCVNNYAEAVDNAYWRPGLDKQRRSLAH